MVHPSPAPTWRASERESAPDGHAAGGVYADHPATVLPQDMVPLASPPLPNEGVWQPTGKLVNGAAAVYSTYFRPDPVHTSLVAGAMWLDMSRLRAVLYNGLEVPGGGPWQHGAHVEAPDSGALVAAFNGGFKLDVSQGGYYTEGQTVRPLVDGRRVAPC